MLSYSKNEFWANSFLDIVNTNSSLMTEVFHQVRKVAPTETTVSILGETGTGKGVLAKIIHNHSKRNTNDFYHVHCGSIPDALLESELFGHEKGAFTSAEERKLGKFEIANDGTIFLDEISTISPSAQIKLLQVLQDKFFYRIGGNKIIPNKARIIVASNICLKEMVAKGLFRKDLYYRLNVFPIELPPLSSRKEDIPLLINAFIKKYNKVFHKRIKAIHPNAMDMLMRYNFPGNIRELENLIERAYILEDSNTLTTRSFPIELMNLNTKDELVVLNDFLPLKQIRLLEIEKVERSYLINTLSRFKGRIKNSAVAAGVSERQLNKLLKKYNLKKEHFKI